MSGLIAGLGSTLDSYMQGDSVGAWASGIGTVAGAIPKWSPWGTAVSLGIGLGQNFGAPLLLSTQWGNDLVNNLSDWGLNSYNSFTNSGDASMQSGTDWSDPGTSSFYTDPTGSAFDYEW